MNRNVAREVGCEAPMAALGIGDGMTLAMSKTIVASFGDALPSLVSGHRPVDPAVVGWPLDQDPLAVRTAGITSVR